MRLGTRQEFRAPYRYIRRTVGPLGDQKRGGGQVSPSGDGTAAPGTAAAGDRQLALDLYEWNAAVSAAVLHDLERLACLLKTAAAETSERTTGLGPGWARVVEQLCGMADLLEKFR